MEFIKFFTQEESIAVMLSAVGVLVATFIIYLGKKLFSSPENVGGEWILETITEKTTRNPYKNMLLKHIIILEVNNTQIDGDSEKIFEKLDSGEEQEYTGKGKIRGSITGTITRNLLISRLTLKITEEGQKRQSTIYCRLQKFVFSNGWKGNFRSTAARSSGPATLKREKN